LDFLKTQHKYVSSLCNSTVATALPALPNPKRPTLILISLELSSALIIYISFLILIPALFSIVHSFLTKIKPDFYSEAQFIEFKPKKATTANIAIFNIN